MSTEAIPPAPDSFGAALDAAFAGTDLPDLTHPSKAPEATPVDPAATTTQADPAVDPFLAMLAGEQVETPKADEPKPDEEFEKKYAEPKDMAPKAGEAFRSLKTDLKTAHTQIEELKAQLAAAPKAVAPVVDPEVDRIKAEHAEMLKEFQVTRVEATPEFKRSVVAPLDALGKTAQAFAKKYEVSEKDLLTALSERDVAKQGDALTALASGFNEPDRIRVYRLAEQFGEVLGRRDEILSDAKLALERIENQRKTEAERGMAGYTQELASAQNETWAGLQKDVPILRKIEGNEVWNTQIDKLEALAKNTDPSKLDLRTQTKALQQAICLPLAMQILRSNAAQLVALQKKVASLSKATPGAGAGGNDASRPGAIAQGASFLDSIESAFR